MSNVKPPVPPATPPSPADLGMPTPLPIELPPPSLMPRPTAVRRATGRQERIDPRYGARVASASTWQIVLALLTDAALLLACSAGIAWIVGHFLEKSVLLDQAFVLDRLSAWEEAHPMASTAGFIFLLLSGGLYAFFGARGSGRTLGRMLTGTVLISKSGIPLSTWRAALRAVLAILCTPLAAANHFYIFVDPLHRPLHDIMAGTIVVKRKPLRG